MSPKKILKISAALLPFCLILLVRLYPLLRFGAGGLGYDTGFYRRYLELGGGFWKPPAFILGPDSLGTRLVLNILSWLKIPTDIALFGSYVLFSLLTGFAIYLLGAQVFKNRLAGIFALALFALSPVQWLAYSFALYKQYWAIWLLFLAFYYMEKRRWFFFLPLGLALFSHRTTALIAAATLGLYVFYTALQYLSSRLRPKAEKGSPAHVKFYTQIITPLLFTTATASAALWLNWPTVKDLILLVKNGPPQLDIFSLTTGIFISLNKYWEMTSLTILLGIFGLILLAKRKYLSPLFFFTIVCGVIVITKSYFYERVIIPLDLSFIILAGGRLAFLYAHFTAENNKSAFSPSYYKRGRGGVNSITAKIIILFLIISLATNLFFTIKEYRPLISANELAEIKNLRKTPENSYIMTFSRDYAPWLYGWGGADKRVISPGLFWDRWNNEQWQEFWRAPLEASPLTGRADLARQIDMLAQYRAPIYIFNPQYDYSNEPCFEKFSEMVWKFKCY